MVSTLCICFLVPLSAQLTLGGFIDLNIAGLNVASHTTGEEYSSFLGFGLTNINSETVEGESTVKNKGLQILLGVKVALE